MNKLEEAIAKLPNTDEEIARFLQERGMVGLCKHAFSCPLARYFQKETGERDAWIDGSLVGYFDEELNEERRVKLPEAAVQFYIYFDDGMYPYLEG